ncbi:inositol monophosphatase [Cellulomonas cellasea]|uniref:Inositol-1-monophosphatase n=2 Tax=Cellulomonas cellasea TaxID=43670 RepID=A0A4Y3L055_9CELL|nr:inositol monophosphatase [Cellulomonas cellasea]
MTSDALPAPSADDPARPGPASAAPGAPAAPALPGPDETRELVALAETLARAAGRLVREGRPDRVDVAATKTSPMDVVTQMDLASEALLRSLIAEHRPHDGILGEEEAPVAGTSGLTWVIDPIDGTVNYLYGIPAYAISVAVVAGPPDPATWTAVAGCVHSVADGRTYTAGRGLGAHLDGRLLALRAADTLAGSLLGTGFGYTVERRRAQARVVAELLPQVRDIRRIGSASLDLCALASGGLDLYYERGLKPWDLAAGALVAQEAGAVVTGLDGNPAGEAMTVAGPAGTVAQLASVLSGLGAGTGA